MRQAPLAKRSQHLAGDDVKIHEYQGKDLFRKYGIAVPHGIPAFSVDEAVKAAKELGGSVLAEPMDIPVGRFAVLADPQGAAFSIFSAPSSD